MSKLRLIITDQCGRQCPGCCNKQFDLDSLPRVSDFTGYDMIMITGGEPMLNPVRTLRIIRDIQVQASCPIIVYTAHVRNIDAVLMLLYFIDGLTVTLHDPVDVLPFNLFEQRLRKAYYFGWVPRSKSLRLNVFRGVRGYENWNGWQVKDNIEWIDPCPLPDDEVLALYPGALEK